MLTKPFEPEELLYRVKNALTHTQLLEENRELRDELAGKFRFDKIIGASAGLKAVLEKAAKVAVRDTSVLITGESGTGKELIAQAHPLQLAAQARSGSSPSTAERCPNRCWRASCSATRRVPLPEPPQNRQGLLEAADGGTLFLDEVGNLPMNVQKTLLRFLQEHEFLRIGETTPDQGRRPPDLGDQRRPAGGGQGRAASARISTTGSMSSTCICRRCGSAARTFPCWPVISSASRMKSSAPPSAASPPRRRRRPSTLPGPATSASCRTSSKPA